MQQRACQWLSCHRSCQRFRHVENASFSGARNADGPHVQPAPLRPGCQLGSPPPHCPGTTYLPATRWLGVYETTGACVSPHLSSGFFKGELCPSAHTPLGH